MEQEFLTDPTMEYCATEKYGREEIHRTEDLPPTLEEKPSISVAAQTSGQISKSAALRKKMLIMVLGAAMILILAKTLLPENKDGASEVMDAMGISQDVQDMAEELVGE